MPITCMFDRAFLPHAEFKRLDYQVMRHAFDCHNTLGGLADERVYQADMELRLLDAGYDVQREVEISLEYAGFRKSLYVDFLVNQATIYELKKAAAISPAHRAQLLTYLYLLNIPHSKILNFALRLVEYEFVNNMMPHDERFRFAVEQDSFLGPEDFMLLVLGLVREWGTCLSQSLYQEAVVALLGGEQRVDVMLPMSREGRPIGTQRFHVLSSTDAFVLTTLANPEPPVPTQLRRLVEHSPLDQLHWVNIGRHEVQFTSLRR